MKILFKEITELEQKSRKKTKNPFVIMYLTNRWLDLFNELLKDKTISTEHYKKYYEKLMIARDNIANVR